MRRYRNGWGQCRVCGRLVAATKAGNAHRHGPRTKKCMGSGYAVLRLTLTERWNAMEGL